ncbi:GIY-YIG nuclease superfamily [Ceraceosorus bombacis]|uniref:GIY-YIG nuclease superfamily n=1 Tax=Ceraceosorus bombacis TaxID=401625 RepID=A0A0N7L359_9BASI|nr:GIY-YIG nuclease superfamily [Ceraceosorus bombacis]
MLIARNFFTAAVPLSSNVITPADSKSALYYDSTSTNTPTSTGKRYNYQEEKAQAYRNNFEIKALIDANPNTSIATPDNINKYLNTKVVTPDMLEHCQSMYDNAKSYPVPWVKSESKEFINDNGPLYWEQGIEPHHAVYHITIAGDDYIGQTSHSGRRVKEHLTPSKGKEKFYVHKKAKLGFVTICLITPKDTIGLDIQLFKNILEQYLILALRPTVNGILVVQRGGDTTNPTTVKAQHALSVTYYVYHNGTLIFVSKTQRELSGLLGKNPIFMANLKKKASHTINDVTLTRTPLVDAPESLMAPNDFAQFIAERSKKVYSKYNPRQIIVIDTVTGERTGPFSTRMATAKSIGTNSTRPIQENRRTPYQGRYYFEFINLSI